MRTVIFGDTYQGSKYSHACAMRRVLEMASGVQVGLRSISGEEIEALPSLPTKVFFAHQTQRTAHWQKEVVEALGDPVYVTIDLDGLDPSIMPAVGTPEPGGLGWYETCELLKRVVENRKIVGFDVTELAPLPGQGAPQLPSRETGLQVPGLYLQRQIEVTLLANRHVEGHESEPGRLGEEAKHG